MVVVESGLYWATGIFFVFLLQFLLIKSRYRKFTIRDYVLVFRNGKLRSKGLGGGYFLIPLIDEIFVLPTTIQESRIRPTRRLTVFVLWRVSKPEIAFRQLSKTTGQEHKTGLQEQVNRLFEMEITNQLRSVKRSDDLSAQEDRLQEYLRERFQPKGIEIESVRIP